MSRIIWVIALVFLVAWCSSDDKEEQLSSGTGGGGGRFVTEESKPLKAKEPEFSIKTIENPDGSVNVEVKIGDISEKLDETFKKLEEAAEKVDNDAPTIGIEQEEVEQQQKRSFRDTW